MIPLVDRSFIKSHPCKRQLMAWIMYADCCAHRTECSVNCRSSVLECQRAIVRGSFYYAVRCESLKLELPTHSRVHNARACYVIVPPPVKTSTGLPPPPRGRFVSSVDLAQFGGLIYFATQISVRDHPACSLRLIESTQVYAYHGQGRSQDVDFLASHDVVSVSRIFFRCLNRGSYTYMGQAHSRGHSDRNVKSTWFPRCPV